MTCYTRSPLSCTALSPPLLLLVCLALLSSPSVVCQPSHHKSRAYQQQEEHEVNRLLREGSPSSLWYSSSAAASAGPSLTGVGAGRIPAQYHHMFHYDGPQPHEHHAHDSPYGAYADDSDPARARFGLGEQQQHDGVGEDSDAAADASHHPPSSYMHEGFLHHVPEWMKKETEQQRDMAHRGGNTAEDKLLAHRRRQERLEQERLEQERQTQKDAL